MTDYVSDETFSKVPGKTFKMVCSSCGGSTFVRSGEEVDAVGFKKFGTGEVVEVEENDLVKTASEQTFTEEDQKALARENADADEEV